MTRAASVRNIGRIWPIMLFGILNLLFLLRFADRDGLEGDDLNSILPMAHLGAAKAGLLLIYRYPWQPLAYELGAALWKAFGTPEAVFLSAPVAGAAMLGLLLALAWIEAERLGVGRRAPWLALLALVAVPEYWFSSLFYNSTIPGMPLAAAAVLLLRVRDGSASAAIAGVLTGLAVLMRADFILVTPLLAMAGWHRGAGIARPIALAAGTIAALAAGSAAGLVDLHAMAEIQRASAAEIRAKADMPGWDLRVKLGVLSICLSPVGWLMLAGGGPLLLVHAIRRERRHLLWLVAALPTVYPLLNILSPKYMLPLALLLPIFFVHAQVALLKRLPGRPVMPLLALTAIVPIFVSISLYGHRPYVQPALLATRPVGTHDGDRSYGGYLWLAMTLDGPAAHDANQRAADQLAARYLSGRGPDLLVAGGEDYFEPGAIGWRHLQLILERRGIHGDLIRPHVLRFVHAGRTLTLMDEVPPRMPPGAELVDLRTPSAGE